jgi:hypothetical protein
LIAGRVKARTDGGRMCRIAGAHDTRETVISIRQVIYLLADGMSAATEKKRLRHVPWQLSEYATPFSPLPGRGRYGGATERGAGAPPTGATDSVTMSLVGPKRRFAAMHQDVGKRW